MATTLLAGVLFVIAITTLISVGLSAAFRLDLKREAPHLFAALKPKSALAFSLMILSHKYRRELAEYPRSRAWASWMFATYWVQLVAFALLAIGLLNK
jgi:hypothetical protein